MGPLRTYRPSSFAGGWENYMRDLAKAAASGTPATSEEIGKIAARYDFRPV